MMKITCGMTAALLLACGLAVTGCASTSGAAASSGADDTAGAGKSSNLTFVFGSKAKGGTVVSNQVYDDSKGYGFAEANVKPSAFAVGSDEASITFKVKVDNGNYNVQVSTDATKVYSETAEGLSPATKGARIQKTGDQFQVAVCDGVLDLTFEEPANVKKIAITPIAPKAKNAKPAIYAIGDSTTKNSNNGAASWGNCVENKWVKLPDTFSAFYNHAMAGRDSIQFYQQARLEAVLLAVAPGDYVTINMGINSRGDGEVESYPALMSNYFVEGVIQRGGIPVIVTRTPDGPVRESEDGTWTGDYDPATNKFTNSGGDGARNDVLRKIAADKGLALIEIGQICEDIFNTYDATYVEDYNKSHGTKFTTPLEMVQSWYIDHNHYYAELGNIVGKNMMDKLEEIASGKTAE